MPADPHWTPLTLVLASTLAVVVNAGLVALARARRAAWAEREIIPAGSWSAMERWQALAAATAWAGAGWAWGPQAAVATAALAWLFVLAIHTDLGSYKIPYDSVTPVVVVGLACFASGALSNEGLLSLASTTVMVVLIPLAASLAARRAIGMSDIRLLWAATATTSWWAGPTWLVYGLIAACLVQVLIRIATARSGFGRPLVVAAAPAPSHRAATETEVAAPTQRRPVRAKRELPFAPALVLGIVAMLVVASLTGTGACATWNPSGVC